MMIGNFKRTMLIGSVSGEQWGRNRPLKINIQVEYQDGRLSLMGNCVSHGHSVDGGQIDMRFAHRNPKDNDSRYRHPIAPDQIKFAAGWNAERWLDLLDIWKRWHLNDLSAACEHQRQLPEFQPKQVTITYATLDWGAHYRLEKQARMDVIAQYGEGTVFYEDNRKGIQTIEHDNQPPRPAAVTLESGYKFSPAIAALKLFHDLNLKPFHPHPLAAGDVFRAAKARKIRRYLPIDFDIQNVVKFTTETKSTNWLRSSEHPEGLLMRPCPVCGYQYGSAWLKEDVPESVLVWLQNVGKQPETSVIA